MTAAANIFFDGSAVTCAQQLSGLEDAYSTIFRTAGVGVSGGAVIGVGQLGTSSPSLFPLETYEYIKNLRTEKNNLACRVSELEADLKDIRVYWPTVKRLLAEYDGASARVQTLVRTLASTRTTGDPLEVARRLDKLDALPDDIFGEDV